MVGNLERNRGHVYRGMRKKRRVTERVYFPSETEQARAAKKRKKVRMQILNLFRCFS